MDKPQKVPAKPYNEIPAGRVKLLKDGKQLKGVQMALQGQGSTGNVIAALASFFIPGLGQLIQGRILMAAVHFVLAAVLWFLFLGWIIHLWSIIDAALFKPKV